MGVGCAQQSINELEAVQGVIDSIGEKDVDGVDTVGASGAASAVDGSSAAVTKSISHQEEEQRERERHEARVEAKRREDRESERERERQSKAERERVETRRTDPVHHPQEAASTSMPSSPKQKVVARDPLGASVVVEQPIRSTETPAQTQTQSTVLPRPAPAQEMDGQVKSMSQSTMLNEVDRQRRVALERKRMNAREAASKLANAF